ncbi:MAG: T9SS type A sorting domain-containing protein, partial [Saprospiraceae bacterium]|nr:T9SS type A sorting domain-containing protein [Saprospiraceae bacterium]
LRSGGIAGVQIMLFDASGQPLRFTQTDQAGAYTFDNLAWGTYRVRFEYAGVHSPEVWVTIGPDHPAANGVVISTSELTSSLSEALEGVEVRLMPQPAGAVLNVQIDAEATADLAIELMDLAGQPVARQHNMFDGSGNATLDVGGLPSGMYLLRLKSPRGQLTRKWIKQ